MLDPRRILNYAPVYQFMQHYGGFFGARLASMARHLPIEDGSTIVDVGCGPGYLRSHLPQGCRYIGYDTDTPYINFARRHHAANAEYHCQIFDSAAARLSAPADIVMMNGLLHHLTDDEARTLLVDATACLRPGGRIFTLDGCYVPDQSWFKKTLLDADRGQYVRSQSAYARLFPEELSVAAFVEQDLSWVPYTFISHVATKPV